MKLSRVFTNLFTIILLYNNVIFGAEEKCNSSDYLISISEKSEMGSSKTSKLMQKDKKIKNKKYFC